VRVCETASLTSSADRRLAHVKLGDDWVFNGMLLNCVDAQNADDVRRLLTQSEFG
jgi:hypothetical protein